MKYPNKPGCYLMKDKNDIIIYIGKAKNLNKRISSYFNKTQTNKTLMLVNNIKNIEYIITNSELEALILEINLIKKHKPKYNILLKDDKSYPYIELTNEKYPRLIITRKKSKNSKLYGPYPNVTSARETIKLLNRIYPLRKCINLPRKVCLYYHIDECLGYCEKEITEKEIENIKKEVIKFLNNDTKEIITKINNKMKEYSKKLEYEKANEMKEMLNSINQTLKTQIIDIKQQIDIDVFGYYKEDNILSIQIIFIRNGKIIQTDNKSFELINDIKEELTHFISTFYEKNIKPNQIIIPKILNKKLISDYLNLKVIIPDKGIKKRILEMAEANAKENISKKLNKINELLKELKDKLNIKSTDRIELYDNSNLFSTYSVSAMVVYSFGRKNKNEYRKFKVKSNNDYDLMKEVIYRRYYKVLLENLEKADLIIVDGGKIQINAAKDVLKSLNLDVPVCGLTKDKTHKTSQLIYKDKRIEVSKKLFNLLEEMQKEVHSFAITYHKNIRSKGLISSELDNIKNIGEKRKQIILKKYQSIEDLKKESLENLNKILPKNVSISIHEYFKNQN